MRRLLAILLTSTLILSNSSFAVLAAELPEVAEEIIIEEESVPEAGGVETEEAEAEAEEEAEGEKESIPSEEHAIEEEGEEAEETEGIEIAAEGEAATEETVDEIEEGPEEILEVTDTEPAYQQVEEAVQEEEETIKPASYLLEDEDILLEQYIEETAETLVEEALYGEVEETLPPTYARYWKLNDAERKAYLILKNMIDEVASGEASQASARFTYADIFPADLLNKKFTAEDFGLASLAEEGTTTPSTAAKAALEAKFPFSTGKIMTALLRDCPSQLYWFDKTKGMSTSYTLGGYSWELINGKVATISMSPSRFYQMSFNVSSDYQDEETEKYFTDIGMTGSVTTSIEKAAQIVADNNGENDYEKLIAYRDTICSLVSYNTAAADKSTNTAYGNPWQLIYVFDGDATTKVVCEGYAKAYKFLCDLSSFHNTSISCSIVSGQMSGGTGAGGHMWNLVSVNGKNYLVDVTNCDSGTIGYPDKLFMLGKDSYATATVTKNGVSYESEKYTFPISSRNISYTYDVDTVTIFDQEERLLAASDYTYVPPIDLSTATVTGVTTKDYTGFAITQKPTVKMLIDGTSITLVEGTDYKLSYENNVNAGSTATMMITGINKYTGTKTATFYIRPDSTPPVIDASSFTVTYPEDYNELGYALPGSVIGFSVKASDNVGMKSVALAFLGPNGENYLTTALDDFDGDGIFTCDCYISPSIWTSSATLTPGRMIAIDTSGNERELTSTNSNIFANGKGILKIHVHSLKKTTAESATCSTAGNKAYWTCAECGKVFSDANAAKETTVAAMTIKATGHTKKAAVEENRVEPGCEKTGSYDKVVYCATCGEELSRNKVSIAALGHSYGAWTKLNATQHQRICKHDSTHVEKANHSWDAGKVTKAATYDAAGVKTYTCTVCKATKTESIPKLVRASAAKANTTKTVKTSAKPAVTRIPRWTRLYGQNALATMMVITQRFGTAKTAVVATNADFKDSLAAAALAGSLGAPMLTTAKGSLSAETKAELNRMGVTTVYLIGTTNDVSTNTEKQIKALSKVKTVKRISASSASAKAIACAKNQKSKSDTVIIATQASFKDALSVSSYAYASKSPILYAESNKKLSSATINYIKNAKFKKVIIVGGPNALPASVDTQLIKNANIAKANITRLAGSNQYNTSRVIAEWATGKLKNGTGGGNGLYKYAYVKFQPNVKLSANNLAVARADDNKIGWKDALAGAAFAGKNKAVLLLADANNYAAAEAFVKANKEQITQGYVLGGTAAVPKNVMEKLMQASA